MSKLETTDRWSPQAQSGPVRGKGPGAVVDWRLWFHDHIFKVEIFRFDLRL